MGVNQALRQDQPIYITLKKPNLTPSFDSYRASTSASSTEASSVIQNEHEISLKQGF